MMKTANAAANAGARAVRGRQNGSRMATTIQTAMPADASVSETIRKKTE